MIMSKMICNIVHFVIVSIILHNLNDIYYHVYIYYLGGL
jgi:hypothetical protein